MNKKGLTIVELLAVIVVVSLISIIVMISVFKYLNDAKKNLSDSQKSTIESAAKNWAADNVISLPDENNEYYDVLIETLQSGGYLPSDFKNPATGDVFSNDSYVRIEYINDNYKYTVVIEN